MQIKTGISLAATLLILSGCKDKGEEVELKGFTGDATTRTIDYAGMYGDGGRTVTFTNIIAYESTYRRPSGGPGGDDEGTIGAMRLVRWLDNEGKAGLFGGNLEVDATKTTLPRDANEVELGRTYTWEATSRNASVRSGDKQVTANIIVRVVLGPSMLGPQLTMPQDFRQELARAMVEDDVVSYNGHIWSADVDRADSPWTQAAIDRNTTMLADAIRNHPTARTKPGLVYMNACRAEKIEAALMDALLRKPASSTNGAGRPGEFALNNGAPVAPILLSHRNYSNFDFFPDHDGTLLRDMMNGCPLPSLMLDLTTTAKGTAFQSSGGSGVCEQDPEAAKKKLTDYLAQPGIRQNPRAVIVVAYDIINGKLKQEM